MKKAKHKALAAFIILQLLCVGEVLAQTSYARLGDKLMPYIVEGGDTIFLSPLAAARVYEKKPRQKGRQWRKYYRLVYNFAEVYPYALVAKELVMEADSTIKAQGMKYVQKDRYVERVVKDLFHCFEKPLRNMTVTQGQLLMKLIDRECNISSYNIILDFKNKFAAGFWQGVAKMFGNDLKKHYDPQGEDEATEELVQQWKNGTFEQTYFEIFWKYPPMIELPPQYNIPNLYPSRSQAQSTQTHKTEIPARKGGSGRK